MPIDKISDIRRFPRLGRIRLGIKKEGQKGSYPSAVDYFVCPEEVKIVHGEQPKELPVMFPNNDLELVAPQWMKCYSYSQGLICKGDAKTCRRKVDVDTGDFVNKDTREWEMHDGNCEPEHCPKIGDKQCRRVMSLLFILPEVPGLGVYQLDTSSFYSIVNLNSQLAPDGFLRHFTNGRIAFIPLILSIGPQEVTPPGIGRKTIHILNVRANVKLADIIRISRQKPAQVLLPTLEEEEPPEDLYPQEVIEDQGEVITAPEEAEVKAEAKEPEIGAISGDKRPRELRLSRAELNQVLRSREGAPPLQSVEKTQPPPDSELEALTKELFPDEIKGEGFTIDLGWLKDSQKTLRWADETMLSFITSQYKVSGKTVTEALNRLTREQAEDFTRQINKRTEKQTTLL